MKTPRNNARGSPSDITTLFFQDIANVPIIHGKRDYLPLIRAVHRARTLKSVATQDPELSWYKLIQALRKTTDSLSGICQTNAAPSLNVATLIQDVERFCAGEIEREPLALTYFLDPFKTKPDEEREAIEKLAWRLLYLISLVPVEYRGNYVEHSFDMTISEYFEQVRVEGQAARTRLIEGTLRYVINIAESYIGRGLEYLDLVQEGIFGLVRAMERFEERKGAHFQHYSAAWIRQRITRALSNDVQLIRVPVHMHERYAGISQLADDFFGRQGREPSLTELSVLTGDVTPDELELRKLEPILRRASTKWERCLGIWELQKQRPDAIPDEYRFKFKDMLNAIALQTEKLGRSPSEFEVFTELGLLTQEDVAWLSFMHAEPTLYEKVKSASSRVRSALERLQRTLMLSARHYSMEQDKWLHPRQKGRLSPLNSVPEFSNVDPLNRVIHQEIAEHLEEVLNARELTILQHRYGLKDGQERTLEDIGIEYGLTRERVRQIEAKAIRKLHHPLRMRKMRHALDKEDGPWHVNVLITAKLKRALDHAEWIEIGEVNPAVAREKAQIQDLIQRYVQRGQKQRFWDTRRQAGRVEVLRAVLTAIGQPVHYSEIHDKAIAMTPEGLVFTKKQTYAALFYRSDVFRSFGNAIFGLQAWPIDTLDADGEVLYLQCPQPLLPPHKDATAFFESVMVGRDFLRDRHLSVRTFWEKMSAWAGYPQLTIQAIQQAFDAWHAVGLLERVDFLNAPEQPVALTLSSTVRLLEAREHCLHHLFQRIAKLPETLLIISRIAAPTAKEIHKLLYGQQAIGADISDRLKLLQAFQAIQAVNDTWRITPIGEAMLSAHPPQELPDFDVVEEIAADTALSPVELELEAELDFLFEL